MTEEDVFDWLEETMNVLDTEYVKLQAMRKKEKTKPFYRRNVFVLYAVRKELCLLEERKRVIVALFKGMKEAQTYHRVVLDKRKKAI